MKNRSYLLVVLLALLGAPSANATQEHEYLMPYATLLSAYVQAGEKQGIKATLVDYAAWGKDPLHSKAMQALRRIDPASLSGREKMAFWINAYNLLTIDLIVQTAETQSIKNQGSLFRNVWKSHVWVVYGRRYTLDEIEHKILRPMGDPRIHFAINCASLSCPDLLAEPYIAASLHSQLEAQTRDFLRNPNKGVSVAASGFKVSKIFKWFAEDFHDDRQTDSGGEAGAVRFIHLYQEKTSGQTLVGYLDYNWRLNGK